MSFPAPKYTALDTPVQNARLRLLNKLRAKEFPLLTFSAIPSPRHVQVIAATGLDGIIIDQEHGAWGEEQVHNSVAVIAGAGISPIIRVRGPNPEILKRALDTGIHGIMVPMINTAEEAQQVVTYSKFPPYGLRGQGSAFPAFGHGLTTPEYMQSANETIVTIVQIESRQGVENVEAIAAIPGIDYLFIGPNDLAQSLLGYTPAKGDEPVFVQAIEKIVAAARKNGKWVGRLVNNGPLALQAKETFDSVAITGDTKAISNWYIDQIDAVRK